MIPLHTVLLLSGIPATGKSQFARYLASKHEFAHYDMEHFPAGWPCQELKEVWEKSRPAFVAFLRQEHQRIVLDWGFPPSCLTLVNELRNCGVQLVWFEGDVAAARKKLKKRVEDQRSIKDFERQVTAIKTAQYPVVLNCIVVPALSAEGVFLDQKEIEKLVFS